MKSARAALCIIPPESVWEPIQAIRRVHDRQIDRWMPHINLLFPFLERCHPSRLEPVCARLARFDVTLDGVRHFTHASGRCTVWLDPRPAAPLVALQAALQAEIPECDDVARFDHGFTPHLSVGQAASERDAGRLIASLAWKPVSFTVDAVCIIERNDGPFGITGRIPLA